MRTRFGQASRRLTLANDVRLRRESFGGIAFHKHSGTLVELDLDAMVLVETIRDNGPVPGDALPESCSIRRSQALKVIDRLLDLGMLEVVAPFTMSGSVAMLSQPTVACHKIGITDDWPVCPHLTAPETIHWAITYRCDSDCPDCYARRFSNGCTGELDTREALRVVDTVADWGVFQLAIGGGEPLLRSDLPVIVRRAWERGVTTNVTTGLLPVPPELLCSLAGTVSVLQFGIKHERLLAEPRQEVALLSQSVSRSRDLGLTVGANLMLCATVMDNIERLVSLLAEAQFDSITVVRYKPPPDAARWGRENPPVGAMKGFHRVLSRVAASHRSVHFRVDCALSFLLRQSSPSDLMATGVRGCVAADRILAISPDGGVYPCSQLVYPELRAGSILDDGPDAVWADSRLMDDYRRFRDNEGYRATRCGACRVVRKCGGCRVYACDRIGADPGCPKSKVSGGGG